jgi:hypothetical protein
MRDEFDAKVKKILAERVNHCCSNPNCRAATSGPQRNVSKAINVGVAAHISAASAGGARYDARLTPEKRRDISNAVWLCQNCAKLIDNDEARFPIELLNSWKEEAEKRAFSQIGKTQPQANQDPDVLTSRLISIDSEVATIVKAIETIPYGGAIRATKSSNGKKMTSVLSVTQRNNETAQEALERLQAIRPKPDEISVELLEKRTPPTPLLHPQAHLLRLYLRSLHPGKSRVVWSEDGEYVGLLSACYNNRDRNGHPDVDYIIKRWVKCLETNLEPRLPLSASKKMRGRGVPFEMALEHNPKMLLLGESGAGKTTVLQQIAYEIVERIYSDVTDPNTPLKHRKPIEIPIRVELKNYNGETELEELLARSMNDVLRTENEALAIDIKASTIVLKAWLCRRDLQFVFLLDGLNEVKPHFRTQIQLALHSILQYRHHVVISCRKCDFDQYKDLLPNAITYQIEPLPDNAIETYLGWLLSGLESGEVSWKRGEVLYREQIACDPRMLDLARNPLLLRLMGRIAFTDPDARLPNNRARLFEKFVEVMFETRAGLDLDVPNYKVKNALARLGFEMQRLRRVTIDLGDLHEYVP